MRRGGWDQCDSALWNIQFLVMLCCRLMEKTHGGVLLKEYCKDNALAVKQGALKEESEQSYTRGAQECCALI